MSLIAEKEGRKKEELSKLINNGCEKSNKELKTTNQSSHFWVLFAGEGFAMRAVRAVLKKAMMRHNFRILKSAIMS